ncbi:hypothetical protein [Rhizobium tubonense]|nr:hypothetical protein [Rhizobium tubonense]
MNRNTRRARAIAIAETQSTRLLTIRLVMVATGATAALLCLIASRLV